MKYRKKPVVIEAVEWRGDNLREVIGFTGWHPSASDKWTWGQYEEVVRTQGLKIFTLEGSHMATIGDMIIKSVKGEFYPCKPDIFAATYELASEAPSERGERAGWVSVPREPNEEQQMAGVKAAGGTFAAGFIVGIYKAMLAARPGLEEGR